MELWSNYPASIYFTHILGQPKHLAGGHHHDNTAFPAWRILICNSKSFFTLPFPFPFPFIWAAKRSGKLMIYMNMGFPLGAAQLENMQPVGSTITVSIGSHFCTISSLTISSSLWNASSSSKRNFTTWSRIMDKPLPCWLYLRFGYPYATGLPNTPLKWSTTINRLNPMRIQLQVIIKIKMNR